jgi:nucleotide-binding universal stress UspA family protein
VDQILVPLDSSPHSFAALHAALDLAGHYNAKIKGIFIEDITLLNLAEMPFRQEVGEYSAIIREISTNGITHGISVQSRWVIRTFQKLINQNNLKGNFSILRGRVLETIKRESKYCDLLVIGKAGKNTLRRQKLGSTARALIHEQTKSLLLVEEENRLGHPMIVLFDDSPEGQVSLETGRDFLDEGETLVILVSDENSAYFQKKKREIINWASRNEINVSIQTFNKRNFTRFIQKIDGLKEGLFILPWIKNGEKSPIIEYCLDNLTLPILLIRHSEPETANSSYH